MKKVFLKQKGNYMGGERARGKMRILPALEKRDLLVSVATFLSWLCRLRNDFCVS